MVGKTETIVGNGDNGEIGAGILNHHDNFIKHGI